MKRLQTVVLVFLIFSISFTTTGCEKKNETTSLKPVNGEVAVIRLEGGDWGYPNPYTHYIRGPGAYKMCLIFDSLLERSESGLIPWLAESWEILDGGKRYRFILRKGVVWHDGTPLTADDVCFSLEYASVHPMVWSSVFKTIESIRNVGNNTIDVTVRQIGAPMLYNLGKTRIIPKHIWEKIKRPKSFTSPEAVIGTGPYRLIGYSKEHGTYRFEAFDRFWGPKPRVRCIEFIPVSESVLAFENGDINLLSEVPPDLLSRYQNTMKYTVVKSPAFSGYRLIFNMKEIPLLRQIEIRRAIRYALDLDELVTKNARGAAIPGTPGILPPDHVMYRESPIQYRYDPAKAIALLEKHGYTILNQKGFRTRTDGTPLAFDLLCTNREVNMANRGREIRIAEIIRQRLGEVGICINIISVDEKARDAKIIGQQYQLAIIGHGGWGRDPDYLRERFTSGTDLSPSQSVFGQSGYVNPTLSRLLEQQYLEMDDRKRIALVGKIQELLAEELPEIPLFNNIRYAAFRPSDYNGWQFMFDHHSVMHNKLSYLDMDWKQTAHEQI